MVNEVLAKRWHGGAELSLSREALDEFHVARKTRSTTLDRFIVEHLVHRIQDEMSP